VLYFEAYVVTDAGMSTTTRSSGQAFSERYLARSRRRDDFSASMGAEGICELLRAINLNEQIDNLRKRSSKYRSDKE